MVGDIVVATLREIEFAVCLEDIAITNVFKFKASFCF